MAERSGDWMRQAEADLRHARNALEDRDFEWAAFASQQSAEKAIKALFQKLHLEAWGHALSLLLASLPADVKPDNPLIDLAKELDKHYIPTRCPNGFDRGAPVDSYTEREAREAIRSAEATLTTVVVKSIDRELVRHRMDAYANWLFESFDEIEEIVAFGSFETGNYAPGSDLDVLIVLSRSARSPRDRIPIFMPVEFPVPIDLFPFTRGELLERAASPVIEAARASLWRYVHS
jgi:HEPN domain-containing protein/predicted nucleotidyltransferase